MWYFVRNNKKIGPVTHNELCELIANGTVIRETPVWKQGMQDWVKAGTIELSEHFSTPPFYGDSPIYSTNLSIYTPDSFRKLWLWFAWSVGIGITTIILLIGILPLIAGIVISYILLYRYWFIIQDGKTRTSPEKAVGFCFIPFFNFYWLYVAVVGLARDMNLYCDERNIPAKRISVELAITWYILILCVVIPYVNIVTTIAAFVVEIILYNQFSKVAVKIVEFKEK